MTGDPPAMRPPRSPRRMGSATDMRWTPDAEKYIRNREFLYYSPVIAVDEKSKPPRIVDVLKSSLTNDPLQRWDVRLSP